jgi:hypothetical protein
MREKVEILERAGQMVLATHRTVVGPGLTAVTVETVTLDPPNRMGFRLLRGPVPHVTETFAFDETADGTRLTYTGELGTDAWRHGQAWGDLVARSWCTRSATPWPRSRRRANAAHRDSRAPASGALGRHSPGSVGRCAHRILKSGGRFPRGAFSHSVQPGFLPGDKRLEKEDQSPALAELITGQARP